MGSTSEGSSNLLGSIGRGGSMGYGGSQGRGGSVGNSGSEAGGLSIVSRNLRHTEQRIGTFQNKLYTSGIGNSPQTPIGSKQFGEMSRTIAALKNEPTSYSLGLYQDSPYGPVLSDLAKDTNYRGNLGKWQKTQSRKGSMLGVETRKRSNQQLGLDQDYGNEGSVASQLAERERIAAERQAGRSGGRLG